MLANISSFSALTHLTAANTDFPIVCSFSGQREDLGPGAGRGEPAALGAEHPAQAWPREGGEWGTSQRAKRLLIQPGAHGPRVHLSSHYCNKSGLHYMKGKMNYRR